MTWQWFIANYRLYYCFCSEALRTSRRGGVLGHAPACSQPLCQHRPSSCSASARRDSRMQEAAKLVLPWRKRQLPSIMDLSCYLIDFGYDGNRQLLHLVHRRRHGDEDHCHVQSTVLPDPLKI
jgi:hypothetical protein